MSKHIGIIGSGIIGLVIARDLARAGSKVIVISDGKAASWCAPGINCIKGLFRGEKDLFRRKISGHHQLWKEIKCLQSLSGLDLEIQTGVIEPILGPDDLMNRSERAFHGRFLGVYGTQAWPRGQPHFVEQLNSHYLGLLLHPHDYSFHPAKTLKALQKINESLGCHSISGFVDSIHMKENRFHLGLSGSKELILDDLVIAAGSGSLTLLNKLGLSTTDFRLKAGISLVAQSQINHAFKMGSLSGVSKNGTLRFGAKDFLMPLEKKDSLIRALQTTHHLSSLGDLFELPLRTYKTQLQTTLEKITPHFCHPDFLAGVRVEGPGRKPFVMRTIIAGKKGPIVATGFHKSAWSLAWEAAGSVLRLLD